MSSVRHVFCTLLVMASVAGLAPAARAANDGIPGTAPEAAQGPTPGAPQTGSNPQTGTPGTRACRQAKSKSQPQLTAGQKAQRKAARQAQRARQAAQGTPQGGAHPHQPKQTKLPLC